MHTRHLSAAVRTGLVTGAATAGTLVGFGMGQGAPLGAFLRYGYALLGPLAGRFVSGVAVFAGIAGHLAWMIVWGAGVFLLARRYRGPVVFVVAVTLAVVGAWSSRALVPSALGAMRYGSLDGVQVTLAVLVMALAMAGGTAMTREG